MVGLRPALGIVSLGLFLTSSFLSSSALGAFPSRPGEDPWLNRPNDPGYANAWNLFSHLPVNHTGLISEWERSIGSGVHADRAWQYHTGTPDTVIAVLDSGINWDADDLLERHFLNPGELPFPEGADRHDANGDGRFSVSDYANDSRVSDANGNGRRDPGDLIAAFSDGIDQDGNGYVDDISGWDFHELDNDPADRTRFGHGTGEAHGSAAALNNGIGHAGICGDCAVMSLRLNDSFIVDANAFAAAVAYATQMRVSLIQQALGSVNWSRLTLEAVEGAYDNGVPIIGSAADENSFHHNYPSTIDPIIYPNAIRYDSKDYQEASTYLNFNNCSNYGARVDVSVPGKACSSEATAILSGVAGLSVSYAKSLGFPLSPGELNSLIKASATDIALGPNTNDPFRHSTYAGWDTITGYGRANNLEMVKRIAEGNVPPEARIVTPKWFELMRIDGGEERLFDVTVEAAVRAGGLTLKLELLRGLETSETVPRVLAEKTVDADRFSGSLGSFRLQELAALPGSPLEHDRNRFAYTLRLTVTDRRGVKAESRRTFFAFEDRYLMPGYPRPLGGSGESAGLFVDLDRNGTEELVTADGSGFVHAFTATGEELPGFPAPTAPSVYAREGDHLSSIVAPIAAGDLDGNGSIEIVTVSFEGDVSVLTAEGKQAPGFPVKLPFPDMTTVRPGQALANGVLASPVLVDLDGNRTLEIVVCGLDGLVHVYRADGTIQPGFPFRLEVGGKWAKIVSSPAIYDVNGDGTPDLILGSNHHESGAGFLFALDGRGNSGGPIAGFPARIPLVKEEVLPTIGVGVPTAPVIADFDGDGTREIFVHPFIGKGYLIGMDGRMIRSLSMKLGEGHQSNDTHMLSALGHPSAGDIDGDGRPDPVTVGTGSRALTAMALGGKKYDVDHMVGAWGFSGAMLAGFPRILEDTALSPSPIVVDLTGDGKAEIVVGSGGYFLHGFSASGEAAGFPHFTGGWMYATPSVGDIDGDGQLEVAVTTREGYAFVWKTDGLATSLKNAWRTHKANNQRTGNL